MSANELKDRGNKAFDAGDYDTAIDLYTQAIALDPRDHVLFSSRSTAYAAQKQWADALTDADECITLNPSWWKGYARMGAALHGARRYAEATAAYEMAYNPALRKRLKEVPEAKDIDDDLETMFSDTMFSDTMFSDTMFSETMFSETMFSDEYVLDKDQASNSRTRGHLPGTAFIQKVNSPRHAHSAMGLHEAILRAVQEAVALRRILAETDPTVTKDLAQSLHNFGFLLSAVGRREDALRAYEEAVKLRRKLAETDPTLTKDLAHSLHNLGFDLCSLSRRDDALRADEEAVMLRRKPAETDPTVTKDLAESLHSLGFDLSSLGRREDALCAREEAVELRRKLAAADPAVNKDLAESLHSLGQGASDLRIFERPQILELFTILIQNLALRR